jgi:hypothetical protein
MRGSCEGSISYPLASDRMTLDAVLVIAISDTTALNVIPRIAPNGNIVNNLLTILVEGSGSLERHGMSYARLLATTHQRLTAG